MGGVRKPGKSSVTSVTSVLKYSPHNLAYELLPCCTSRSAHQYSTLIVEIGPHKEWGESENRKTGTCNRLLDFALTSERAYRIYQQLPLSPARSQGVFRHREPFPLQTNIISHVYDHSSLYWILHCWQMSNLQILIMSNE